MTMGSLALQYWAGEGIVSGVGLKIRSVLRREYHQIGLCVALTHSGSREVDLSAADIGLIKRI